MERGIQNQLTISYSLFQNRRSEKHSRTYLSLVWSKLAGKYLPKKFWAEALSTAMYIKIRVVCHCLPSNTTPHHVWSKSKPNISHVRVVGGGFCTCNLSWNFKHWTEIVEKPCLSAFCIIVRHINNWIYLLRMWKTQRRDSRRDAEMQDKTQSPTDRFRWLGL